MRPHRPRGPPPPPPFWASIRAAMTAIGQDSPNIARLRGRRQSYDAYSLLRHRRSRRQHRLPFSMKVRSRISSLRRRSPSPRGIQAIVAGRGAPPDREIQYRPARVLMQDVTGCPALDLAASATRYQIGGDPARSNAVPSPRHRSLGDVDESAARRSRTMSISKITQHGALRVPPNGPRRA